MSLSPFPDTPYPSAGVPDPRPPTATMRFELRNNINFRSSYINRGTCTLSRRARMPARDRSQTDEPGPVRLGDGRGRVRPEVGDMPKHADIAEASTLSLKKPRSHTMLKSIVARPLARVLALGAVHLVLSLVVMSTVVLAQSGTTTYIIRSGDSLRQIAEDHGTTIEEILALNPSIGNANQIYVGATILLPGEEEVEEEADPGTATAVCPNTYTTVAGDTFASIAAEHNVEASTLALVNNKSVVSWLAAGTELCIPGGTGGTPTTSTPITTPSTAPRQPTATQPAVPQAGQGEGRWYTIQRGDFLARIARSVGCGTSFLAQVNNIANPSLVYTGQRIWLPASCTGPVPTAPRTPAPAPAPAPAPLPLRLRHPLRLRRPRPLLLPHRHLYRHQPLRPHRHQPQHRRPLPHRPHPRQRHRLLWPATTVWVRGPRSTSQTPVWTALPW